MKSEQLKRHIKGLACIDESEAPLISCYIDLTLPTPEWREQYRSRVQELCRGISDTEEKDLLIRAFEMIDRALARDTSRHTKGTALFARSGDSPFFLSLFFDVKVPLWISVDRVPNIYYLVELQERHDRYIVLVSQRDHARIFEINLGAVSLDLFMQRPKLRKRVGREWTLTHYQNHKHEREMQFIREKIAVLDRLVSAAGCSHVILAGDPQRISEIRRLLPTRLSTKVIDTVPLSGKAGIDDVIAGTLDSFIAAEERESMDMVNRFIQAFHKGGLAVAGAAGTLQALLRDQADVIVVSAAYQPESAHWCELCGWAAVGEPIPRVCADCGSQSLKKRDARLEIIRLAQKQGCRIETVASTTRLDLLGGIGCLLRYRTADWKSQKGFSLSPFGPTHDRRSENRMS